MGRLVIVEEEGSAPASIGGVVVFIIVFVIAYVAIFTVHTERGNIPAQFHPTVIQSHLNTFLVKFTCFTGGFEGAGSYSECLIEKKDLLAMIVSHREAVVSDTERLARDYAVEEQRKKTHEKEMADAKQKRIVDIFRKGNFVDLKDITGEWRNIRFKDESRDYLINISVVSTDAFNDIMYRINKYVHKNMVITETTRGVHRKGKYSHKNGYKIDIRSKNLTYSEIVVIFDAFRSNDIYIVYEYENNPESIELAQKLKKERGFPIRKSIGAEHLDVNLAKGLGGNLKI